MNTMHKIVCETGKAHVKGKEESGNILCIYAWDYAYCAFCTLNAQ